MIGQKALTLCIIAMFLTAGLGYLANVNETTTTKTTYSKISDLEGIIGENSSSVDTSESYQAVTNVTGWRGNTVIPTLGLDEDENQIVSPYVINPRTNSYTYKSYSLSVYKFTLTDQLDIEGRSTAPSYVYATTNTANVTYDLTPIQEDSSAWLTYSDGSALHGGITYSPYSVSIYYPPVYPYFAEHLYYQTGSFVYYMGDEIQLDKSFVAFATVSDLMGKLGVTLTNEYICSFEGNILYDAQISAEKSVEVITDTATDKRSVGDISIHLDGKKSTTNVIKYFQGGYQGIDSKGQVVWESDSVYVWTSEKFFICDVGKPAQTNPTYADPYQFVTITNSEIDMDEHTVSDTYDYSNVIQTTGDVYHVDNTTFNYWTEFPEFKYITGFESTGQMLELQINLSDGSSLIFPDNGDNILNYGVRGFYNAGKVNSTPSWTYYIALSLPGQQEMDLENRNKVATVYIEEILEHFYPNPQQGDIVQMQGAGDIPVVYTLARQSEGLGNNSIEIATYPTSSPSSGSWYSVDKGYYMKLTDGTAPASIFTPSIIDEAHRYVWNPNNSAIVQLSDVWFEYTADGWLMKDTQKTYPRNSYSFYENSDKSYIAYCIFPDGNIDDLAFSLSYRTANLSWETTNPDVYVSIDSSVPNTYYTTNDERYCGGAEGSAIEQGITYSLEYHLRDGIEMYSADSALRWASLDKVWASMNQFTTVGVEFVFTGHNGLYLPDSIETVASSTSSSVSYFVTYVGEKTDITKVVWVDGVYLGYNGDTQIWAGELSDLDLVIFEEESINVSVTHEGYRWAPDPSDDSRVGIWSNATGLENTLINQSVTFLLLPAPDSNVNSELLFNVGIEFGISATTVGGGNQYVFEYIDSNGVANTIGQYLGLMVKIDKANQTITFNGISSYINPVAYTIVPIASTFAVGEIPTLSTVYMLATEVNWNGYVVDTEVLSDPYGYLWSNFNVNLEKYFPQDLLGFRMTIGGVVRYGDSLTINNIELPVSDGKFRFKEKWYPVKGLAIDFSKTGNTYLRVSEGITKTLDLGETENHWVSGTGTWYFSSGAFSISEVEAKAYEWNPGWELSVPSMVVLFLVIMVGLAVVCMRIDTIDLDVWDYIVIIGTIIICVVLLSVTEGTP